MISVKLIIIGLIQALVVLLVAPLFSGFSRQMRAKMHNRRGPGVMQNYRDLAKLMKRQEVVPEQAGWFFHNAPYITMASTLLVLMIIPIITTQSPFGWVGDLILVVYLYTLTRFVISISGLESGSTFSGIGSRRELLVSVLIEPVILLVLFVMALLAGSTNLGVISTKIATGQIPYYTSVLLGMLAFAFASYVEMGKLPFDLGEAEQELQEGPLTEYSGRALALMKWGIYVKQVSLVALFFAVFLPFGSMTSILTGVPFLSSIIFSIVIFLLKVLLAYFVVALLENAMARLRFIKTSVITWAAFGAAILSFVFYLANV
ncbi:MAG TPA: respiratory chain complex I subunit 1 family protein [Anaerolineales bacterium]|nr:respiratory chain complex I subunit 1 family protein [Anaerolineales bacterium]